MSGSFLSRLPLSRTEHDRDYLSRNNPHLFAELAADPSTRVLPLWNGQALVENGALRLLENSAVPMATLRLYLGRTSTSTSIGTDTDADTRTDADADAGAAAGIPVIAAVVTDEVAEQLDPDPAAWGNLRSLGDSLSDRDAGLFTEAVALANWHQSHGFSPRTGEATTPDQAGWVRRGPSVDGEPGHEIFPRTDAAIIVGITDADDRILLGSNALWEKNRYSLLAGFVEPGESLEEAVAREVFEESGVHVVDPVYLGSQPWPFPASLMLGFRARVDPDRESTTIPDGAEILDLRWFSRDELRDSLDEVILPGRTSIARAIIEDWYGGPIEDRHQW
ncbi:MAG: hydrolase, family [Microbacteriaceae bacterium]|nr:hydrolase, family [Microbacteriaceae bacterium]